MSWTPPAWDQLPEVVSPVGRTAAEQFAIRPRRQPLGGFEPVYSDLVDYIIRCTHRIWEEKNPGLVRTHYGADCRVHMLGGPVVGAETVVQSTVATLATYSDRLVVGEDVIWSEDGPRLFLSSHRITSNATQLGDESVLGQATLGPVTVTTIADCLCRENLIIEEWLVRDNIAAARGIGADPWAIAAEQAEGDRAGDPARHAWRAQEIARVRAGGFALPAADHPAHRPAVALDAALNKQLHGHAAGACSPAVETCWPAGRHGIGRGYWAGCLLQIGAVLHDARWSLDHHAARPLPGGDIAVALRWTLTGRHLGHGVWGAPSGRDILVLAVSHLRLRGGLIVEDVTVFDELAVLRQILGGAGA